MLVFLSSSYRLIRVSASDQFFYIVTKASCNSSTSLLVSFISLLFSAVEVSIQLTDALEFFQLSADLSLYHI